MTEIEEARVAMKTVAQLIVGAAVGVALVVGRYALVTGEDVQRTIPTNEFKACHDECSISMKKNLRKLGFEIDEVEKFNVPQKCVDFCVEALKRKHSIPFSMIKV